MFRGRYQHTIDPKGRLSVPAKFRDALAQYDGALVVVPNEHCLEVHPLEEWQRIEARLREQSFFSAEVQELGRLYICLLYTSPSPRDGLLSRMPSSA